MSDSLPTGGVPPTDQTVPPFDLQGLKTYDLASRPSKVFAEDLGQTVGAGATVGDWIDSLPRQLAGNDLRAIRDQICRAYSGRKTSVAALGGHVIKTGCGPYLIDWVKRGLLTGIAMNGAAAIHDLELALAGKTSEDVGAQLHAGRFGMARETADAFAVAARCGAESQRGLGWALGKYLAERDCTNPECSLLLACYQADAPCTVHVALGTDIVHMHAHVSGAALGEASMLDFRRLCTLVSRMHEGVWLNFGSAVVMPEVFLKTVSVVRNFGYDLDGLVTVNLDKQVQYRSKVNVLDRPSTKGLELIGCHEILLPLLHAAVAHRLTAEQYHLRSATRAA
ncbi:MAG TPA: hypothetical protein VGP68_21040 [Gemmataceae bacterium]|jgi:hypothetical protein|nr:hypothetical protein [Gemmataceae bacterium]